MNVSLQKTVVALWSKPDPVLVGAGAAGELFIAKLRLGLAAVHSRHLLVLSRLLPGHNRILCASRIRRKPVLKGRQS